MLDGSGTCILQYMFVKDFLKGDLHVSEMYDIHKLISVDRLLFQILTLFRIVIMTGMYTC